MRRRHRPGADEGTTTDTSGTATETTTGTTAPAPPTDTTPTVPVPKPRPRPKPAVPKLIAAGVTVGGTLVGGLTAAEAREIVQKRFARPLTLVVGTSRKVAVTPQELGAASHLTEAIKLAARVRRPGFIVPLKVDVSSSRVERLVSSIGKRYRREPVDAELKLRKLVPFATKDVPGRRLKRVVSTREPSSTH